MRRLHDLLGPSLYQYCSTHLRQYFHCFVYTISVLQYSPETIIPLFCLHYISIAVLARDNNSTVLLNLFQNCCTRLRQYFHCFVYTIQVLQYSPETVLPLFSIRICILLRLTRIYSFIQVFAVQFCCLFDSQMMNRKMVLNFM